MESPRTVSLFRNGRNQAVRIPRELEMPGKEAKIFRDGDRLVLESTARRSLLRVLASLPPVTDEFPDINDD